MLEEKLKIIQDTPSRYHFKTKDNQQVSIEHKDKGLALGLYKWGEEAFFEMFLNMVLNDKLQFLENRVELETPALKLRAYPIDARSTAQFYGDSEDQVQCDDGGLRFELVLKAKPPSNSFTIPIKSKNLRFSYQPFLTEQDIAEGANCPFNVEGSYAVYHATKKNNQYMTGKAFHIYRPIAEDALGKKAWCSLHIDGYLDPKNLTITVPQQFLNEAVYPVTIDPDFGFTSIGGTSRTIAEKDYSGRAGSAWPMPEGGGTANYIRAWIGGSATCDCKVFINQKDSGGAGTHGQIATEENLACVAAYNWKEFTLAEEALTSEIDYILDIMGKAFVGPDSYYMYYDNNGAVASYYDSNHDYATPENPWTQAAEGTTRDYSIYCNYDEALIQQAVGGGAVTMAGSLGIKVKTSPGGGAVTMAGTLDRKTLKGVGAGAVGMAGALGRRIFKAVGEGDVGMAGTLAWKFVQAVGGGAVGMAGALGRRIFKAVGEGAVPMTGLLNRLTKTTVGGGIVGIIGTLVRLPKIGVGGGAVAIKGKLSSLFVLHYTVVKIAGVQIRYVKGSLKIDKRIEERSTVEFTVWDKTAASHYVKGQPIQIYDNGNHLTFAGFIHSSEEKRVGASSLFHLVRCADNHYLADKRLAAETYIEETPAGDIVLDLWAKYLDGEGVTVGEIQDGPAIGQVIINYVRVSEALDALAELANFIWYIDEDKRLYFISRATNVAWWTATSSLIDHARMIHGNPLYRNRQYSRGGKSETSEQVENRTGDGEQDSFAMGYPLAKVPTITVAGRGAQTVGIKGLEAGEKDWYWSKGDPVVTADVPPEADAAIQITYIGEWTVFTLTESEAAIADRKSVEGGGSGYVDDIFRDTSLTTAAASLEKAAAKLARYGVTGRKLIYETYQRGLEPGQLQTVNYPLLNLNNAEMLVESVRIRVSGKKMIYYVTALEGPEVGSWSKIFQQLVEREKTIDRLLVGGDVPLIILKQVSEEWGWNEEVVVTVPEILRPNAAGDETSIPSQYPEAGSHWQKVDEAEPDDADYVFTSIEDGNYYRDLYGLPASIIGAGTINKVVVHFRARASTHGHAMPSLKSNSTVTDGEEILLTGAWVDYSQEWALNPADSEAWEWADIGALQIGVSLEMSICFTGDTRITMADGSYKEAKDICPGDRVAYFDFIERKVKSTTVTKVNEHSADEMGPYYLVLNKVLKVTPNHPLDKPDGTMITADEVSVGDFIKGERGSIEILSVEKVWEKVKTFSLETDSGHYFIDGFSDPAKPASSYCSRVYVEIFYTP